MKMAVLFASALLCSSLSACSTKRKLDRVLDNADKALENANKRIDELAELASNLESDLSDAAQQAGDRASETLSRVGRDVPASGGQPRATEDTADIDDDGQTDRVSAVEYEDQLLWLADASTLEGLACNTQLYFVSDKPPESLLSWGLYAEECGAMACPPEELEEDEPDFDTCNCVDAYDRPSSCQDFLSILGGKTPTDDPNDSPSEQDVFCDDGFELIPISYVCDGEADCSDASDEAYCA
jgi:hypothetical protein